MTSLVLLVYIAVVMEYLAYFEPPGLKICRFATPTGAINVLSVLSQLECTTIIRVKRGCYISCR